MKTGDYSFAGETLMAFICYLKASKPALISEIENERINSEELMKRAGLPGSLINGTEFSHIKKLHRLVVFD